MDLHDEGNVCEYLKVKPPIDSDRQKVCYLFMFIGGFTYIYPQWAIQFFAAFIDNEIVQKTSKKRQKLIEKLPKIGKTQTKQK